MVDRPEGVCNKESMAALPIPIDEQKRKVWTREESRSLRRIGFFAGERYELIGGELIDKTGQNPPHASSVMAVVRVFADLFGLQHLRVQLPIEVAVEDRRINEPEPDIVVTAGKADQYEVRHPHGKELLLLVEVSDTSVRLDRLTKASLYARAGVPEYWVLDVQRRECVVHRDPRNGEYRELRVYTDADGITLDCGEVEVRRLLPKQRADES